MSACKSDGGGGGGGDEFASCAVTTEELQTPETATTSSAYICEPTAVSTPDFMFKFYEDGEACIGELDGDGNTVAGGCGGTWTRSSCISLTAQNTEYSFFFDAVNPTAGGFNVNLGDGTDTYSYACVKYEVEN